ncbi:MAG: Rpn family recombination-promoting nuclease/putative transposase [Saprospiraceae bacterium]|nr:Rpn family recombination-promoting nuclease/putative transposase [Saprospiraceae bacterium]
MDDKITNPHDKFVRETFSDTERAMAFFEKFLPEQVRNELNLASLKVSKESYIGSDLSEYLSDIVFEVKTATDKPIDLVLLFEHKSSPDRYTLIQVGHYMFAHWTSVGTKRSL